MSETELVRGVFLVWIDDETCRFPISPAPRRVLQRVVVVVRIPNSIIQNISKLLVHMLPYKISRVQQFQQQCYARRVTFQNRVWTTGRSSQVFYVKSHTRWMCLSCLRIYQQSEQSCLVAKWSKTNSRIFITEPGKNNLVFCAREWCVR